MRAVLKPLLGTTSTEPPVVERIIRNIARVTVARIDPDGHPLELLFLESMTKPQAPPNGLGMAAQADKAPDTRATFAGSPPRHRPRIPHRS